MSADQSPRRTAMRPVPVIVGEWIELCTLDINGTFVAVPGAAPVPLPDSWRIKPTCD